MAKSMFDIIKKQNGETFAKAIRNYDNGIFDIPNLDKIVKYAGREAEPIMNYLVSLKNIQIEEMSVHRDPIELLDKAGYKAWYVNNEEEQNAIAGYFRDKRSVEHGMTAGNKRTDMGECICTIHTNWAYGAKRFNDYYIINAVKKEAFGDDKLAEDQWHIKPLNNPEREDKYGTSVISIQVLKKGGFISIKNRYNHTVDNPDNTFNSNPDNIIRGLSDAIKHKFNVDFSCKKVGLVGKYTLVNNQIFKYVDEFNNIYFGEDAYVKDGNIIQIDKNKELLIPNLGVIIDLQKGTLNIIASYELDDFLDTISKNIKGKKIKIQNLPDKTKQVYLNDILFLELNSNREMCFVSIPGLIYAEINKKVTGNIDLSGYKMAAFIDSDLTNANLEFGENDIISIRNSVGLHGEFDFSNAKEVYLDGTSLDKVTGMKFNGDADNISGISQNDVNRFKLINATKEINKESTKKGKKLGVKKDARTM